LNKSDPKRAVASSIANTWPLLRALKDVRPKPLAWRSERSYLLSTKAEMLPTAAEDDADDSTGTLCVSGYLRGLPMNVHQLIHIPGQGSFQVKKAVVLADPHAISIRTKASKGGMDVESCNTEGSVVREIIPEESKLQSLESEAEPDLLSGEVRSVFTTHARLRDHINSNVGFFVSS
jgi:pre-rRNA-processing protein TSR1